MGRTGVPVAVPNIGLVAKMSKNNDVVFADSVWWTRCPDACAQPSAKNWWLHPEGQGVLRWAALKDLKNHDDFRWIVKNGTDLLALNFEAKKTSPGSTVHS